MKLKPLLFLLNLGLLFSFPLPITAQNSYPDSETFYVNDFADILTPEEEAEIETRLSSLLLETGVEMTVLTLDSWQAYGTGDSDFESFVTNLFNEWGIGSSETNDGILFLITMEERDLRIETGVGLENTIQAEVDDVLDNTVLPLLREGEFGQGMVAGTLDLAERVRADKGSSSSSTAGAEVVSNTGAVSSSSSSGIPETGRVVQTESNGRQNRQGGILGLLLGFLGIGGTAGGAWLLTRPPKCPHCSRPLRKLGEVEDDQFLNEGQLKEERFNSVDYEVWVCDFDDYVDINPKNRMFSSYQRCSSCRFKTASSTAQVIRAATTRTTGVKEVTLSCQHCGNISKRHVTLPRIKPATQSSSSSSRSYSSSSSRPSSSSRSSSRSRGGGRSSGGGSSRKF